MEDIINRIIQIEQEAQRISSEAAEKLENVNDDIAAELEKLADKLHRDAENKIKQIMEMEQKDEQTIISQQTAKYNQQITAQKQTWENNKSKLADDIFARIVYEN